MEERDTCSGSGKRMRTTLTNVVLDCVMPYILDPEDRMAVALNCVMPYIHDPKDRAAFSQVCRQWYELDSTTRKHVTIALCYTTTPDKLRRRFPNLESLKLKGKPRAAMFYNLIPENWGGYVTPWVIEIAKYFNCLKSVHFRRMIINDSDLEIIARSRGHSLHALKLDKCSGFSTVGLFFIGHFCSSLRHLFMEESSVIDKDGQWLHELALNNTDLETLNFYNTDIANVSIQDLELIAKNCRKLVSVKVSYHYEILKLVNFFRYATSLEEFCGGSYKEEPENYSDVSLPAKLNGLGLSYTKKNLLAIAFPCAAQLKKLDLVTAMVDTEDHCTLIQSCPNLEVLESTNVIGDRGLEVVAQCCRKLKRLRVERSSEGDVVGVSHRGLIALSHGCPELEYMAIYIVDITNASLKLIGQNLKNLCDFRLALVDPQEKATDLPLDDGVRDLLRGCEKLRRFALFLRAGGLTNVGLGYIGQYSPNVRWMFLGNVGENDAGLFEFSMGCRNLQKLEMMGCHIFSQYALAITATRLTSLRFLWVEGYGESTPDGDLMAMDRPYWNIELIPFEDPLGGPIEDPSEDPIEDTYRNQIIGYYSSLAGQRSDIPHNVKRIN